MPSHQLFSSSTGMAMPFLLTFLMLTSHDHDTTCCMAIRQEPSLLSKNNRIHSASFLDKSLHINDYHRRTLIQLRAGSSSELESSSATVGGGGDVAAEMDDSTLTDSTLESADVESQEVMTMPPPASAPAQASTTTTKKSSILQNPKVANAIERTIPAILMLSATTLLIKYTGDKGLIALIAMLQVGMFIESTNVLSHRPLDTGLPNSFEEWWWFGTVFCGTTLRHLVLSDEYYDVGLTLKQSYDLGVFGMVALGLVMGVMGMAMDTNAGVETFQAYLSNVAGTNFALMFLLGQSSFLIKTIQSFGIQWILYPASLVIINDTMAYVFGMLFGKHKLIPLLSPKKTVEGFVGAGLSTAVLSIPLLKYFARGMTGSAVRILGGAGGGSSSSGKYDGTLVRHALVMAAYTSFISPFGGFLASAVKRANGAKDFGCLIPGHGGVIDRFDCQIVTAPFVFLYLKACLEATTG